MGCSLQAGRAFADTSQYLPLYVSHQPAVCMQCMALHLSKGQSAGEIPGDSIHPAPSATRMWQRSKMTAALLRQAAPREAAYMHGPGPCLVQTAEHCKTSLYLARWGR